MTGKDTYWATEEVTITLPELLEHTSEEVVMDAKQFEPLLIDVEREEQRIANADLSYPIVVSIHEGEFKQILDGQHRVIKAIRGDEPVKVRFLDLDTIPSEIKNIFSMG